MGWSPEAEQRYLPIFDVLFGAGWADEAVDLARCIRTRSTLLSADARAGVDAALEQALQEHTATTSQPSDDVVTWRIAVGKHHASQLERIQEIVEQARQDYQARLGHALGPVQCQEDLSLRPNDIHVTHRGLGLAVLSDPESLVPLLLSHLLQHGPTDLEVDDVARWLLSHRLNPEQQPLLSLREELVEWMQQGVSLAQLDPLALESSATQALLAPLVDPERPLQAWQLSPRLESLLAADPTAWSHRQELARLSPEATFIICSSAATRRACVKMAPRHQWLTWTAVPRWVNLEIQGELP